MHTYRIGNCDFHMDEAVSEINNKSTLNLVDGSIELISHYRSYEVTRNMLYEEVKANIYNKISVRSLIPPKNIKGNPFSQFSAPITKTYGRKDPNELLYYAIYSKEQIPMGALINFTGLTSRKPLTFFKVKNI